MRMKEEQLSLIKEQIARLKRVPGGFYQKRLAEVEAEDINLSLIHICISDLGCPALIWREEEQKAAVEPSLCYGCSLCAQVCPVGAIRREAK